MHKIIEWLSLQQLLIKGQRMEDIFACLISRVVKLNTTNPKNIYQIHFFFHFFTSHTRICYMFIGLNIKSLCNVSPDQVIRNSICLRFENVIYYIHDVCSRANNVTRCSPTPMDICSIKVRKCNLGWAVL